MSQTELLIRVVDVLESLGISFMLTGSVVSSLQGEPRASHDIDILVELVNDKIADLVAAFPDPDFYLAESSVRDAVMRRSMFNLLSLKSGDKVDFWLITATPFDQSRFTRRVTVSAFGRLLPISTPEDTILAKLRWSQKSGGSEKQELDALRVYELNRASLDLVYLSDWVQRLKMDDLWSNLKSQAGEA